MSMGVNKQFENLGISEQNNVNAIQPEHYCKYQHDPLEMAMEWGLDFPLGNVIKYVVRAGHKAGNSEIQDLKKAMEYLSRKIEHLEKHGNGNFIEQTTSR